MTREELEWSASSPLSRRAGVGMCPYCGHTKTQGHDPECAFLNPKISLEQIHQEIEDTKRQNYRELCSFFKLLGDTPCHFKHEDLGSGEGCPVCGLVFYSPADEDEL